MARTALTIQSPPGKYPATPIAANGADFTWEAGDAGDNNSFKSTGREIVLVRNDNAGAQTVTIHSMIDERNREGDITAYSIGAGEYAVFGPFPVAGWRQPDGTVHIDPSHADLKFAVLQLPALS